MLLEINEDTLKKAIEKWGEQSQMNMAVGEIGELLTLFGRATQGRDTEFEWRTELADAIIMILQVAMIKNDIQAVIYMVENKVNALKSRLEED